MDELLETWPNKARAAHYREQAQKFRTMADAETVARIRINLLELAEQDDGLALRLTEPAAPDARL